MIEGYGVSLSDLSMLCVFAAPFLMRSLFHSLVILVYFLRFQALLSSAYMFSHALMSPHHVANARRICLLVSRKKT